MATTRRTATQQPVDYPTSDGKPMAETDVHRKDMNDLITTLEDHFAADPWVYVSGNLLLYYEEGNKWKHVSPDVLMVRGVAKRPLRDYYLLWEEGRAPDLVIELTSKSTCQEDRETKLVLYRDVLQVSEYFLFDPREEYLEPSMQGYRLVEGQYVAIGLEAGRLPSDALGLHLERRAAELRLYDPAIRRCLLTPQERAAEETQGRQLESQARQQAEADLQLEAQARERAEQARRHAEAARQRAEQNQQREAEARQKLKAENERLRQELEAWKRRSSGEA